MLVRTDDEVYRVDGVWLGPPRATFPWRVRYVSYGLGLLIMIAVMFVQRRVGIGLDFFSVAWALVLTVLVTRFIGKRIDYERPLGQVLALFRLEVTGPRMRTAGAGGPVRSAHVRTGPVVRPRGARRSAQHVAPPVTVTARPVTHTAPVAHAATNRPVHTRTGRSVPPALPVPVTSGRRAAGRKGRRARGKA